jgi:hypothetical protein
VFRSKRFGVTLVEDVGMNLATSATHQAIWTGVFLVAALQTGSARQEVAAPCDRCELRFDLAAEKPQYEVGEPIGLSIRLTNVGTRPVAIQHTSDITGRHDGYRFEVFNESGTRIADPGLRSLSLLGSLGGTYPLAPGSGDSRQFTLNYQVAPLKQGRYRVQGRFNSNHPNPGLHADAASLSFEIVDTPRSRVRQRVAELVRDVNGDPRRVAPLLGFTGDTTAIAPLVDLLYRQDDGVQASAVDALLFLDRAEVTNALLDALKGRGARYRLVEFLVLTLQAPAAEMRPSLLRSLADSNPDARAAAVDGLRLSYAAHDPMLFAPLAGMLRDSVAKVRFSASTAVGGYEDEAALKALKVVVADTDPDVSEQATICIGWIAESASRDSETRKEAVNVLRSVAASSRARASQQAKSWLARIGSH